MGILTFYAVAFIRAKVKDINSALDNDLAVKYITMAGDTVANCVIATSQTYVDSLKKQNKFDGDAQKHAFEMTYDAVMQILTDDAKTYLTSIYGDLNIYLTTLIEAEVNRNK
jgi:hypothetical protein